MACFLDELFQDATPAWEDFLHQPAKDLETNDDGEAVLMRVFNLSNAWLAWGRDVRAESLLVAGLRGLAGGHSVRICARLSESIRGRITTDS